MQNRRTRQQVMKSKVGVGIGLEGNYSWYQGRNGAVVVTVLPSIPIWAASARLMPVAANTIQPVLFTYRRSKHVMAFSIGEFRVWCIAPATSG